MVRSRKRPTSDAPVAVPRVLVICHGNKWRSPLSAAAMRAVAGGALEIKSAGFRSAGQRAARPARLMAAVLGYDLEDHRTALVSDELIAWADLIIYMDGGNRARLEAAMRAAGSSRPYACLGRWASPARSRIPDPAFVRDKHAFSALMCAIDAAAQTAARTLVAAGGVERRGFFSSLRGVDG